MSYDKTYVELHNGHKMPIVGLGTWQGQKDEVKTAVKAALDLGYRHIDTAFVYQNEREIGEVLKDVFANGKIKREDLFIVTKLPANGLRKEHVKHFLETSLKRLQLDYVDLYLMHVPFGYQHVSDDDDVFPVDEKGDALIDPTTDLVETWKKMEEMVDLGLTKSIGVSNFSYEQVKRILEGSRIKPATNQVECHAYLQQRQLFDFCKKHGVTITAYAPIGSPGMPGFMETARGIKVEVPNLLSDPVIKKMSEKYKKTPAQILLRFLMQHEIIVIPKSVNPQRIKENFNVFDFKISPEDITTIEGLERNCRMFKFNWHKKLTEHPEYKRWAQYC